MNSSSNFNSKILTFIVSHEGEPVPLPSIRKAFNMSSPAMSYHVKQLCSDKLIEMTAHEGCKFFKATEAGRIKIVSQGLRPPLTGLHAIGFKFPITRQPALPFGKPIALANNTQFRGWFKDAYYCRTTKHLVIRPIPKGDRMPGVDPFKLREMARDKAIVIAQELASRYDMGLGLPEDEAKGEYATSDIVAEHMEVTVKTTDAIIDRSLGEGEIDWRNREAAKEYLRMPWRVAQIEQTMAKMTELLALQAEHQGNMERNIHFIAENYAAHVGVVVDVSKTMSSLNKWLQRQSQMTLREFK